MPLWPRLTSLWRTLAHGRRLDADLDDELNGFLEEITARAFLDVRGIELPRPFPRASYAEVMARYGSDRPDTRIALELVDLTDLVANSAFQVFTQAVQTGGVVRALPIPDAPESCCSSHLCGDVKQHPCADREMVPTAADQALLALGEFGTSE